VGQDSKSCQKVSVILVPAFTADLLLYLWTSFVQCIAASAHHCPSWGRIAFPIQPGHYFPLNNSLFRISISLSVVTNSEGAVLRPVFPYALAIGSFSDL